ncbi:MAG: hypothetical protein IKL33_02725 [Alphaproteobacteria bacterium]|nr:hypothetical protein [Alphaproteobacteria bacterium]
MSCLPISSVFEVSDWFFRRADQDDKYIDNDKIQQMLLMAQIHFMLNNGYLLFPAVFMHKNNKIIEPNLTKILEFGLPLMPKPKFNDEISGFLELIWQKYSPMEIKELDQIISSHIQTSQQIISLEGFAQSFKSQQSNSPSKQNKKILISQNGPVVVSQWKPRKINNIKESDLCKK